MAYPGKFAPFVTKAGQQPKPRTLLLHGHHLGNTVLTTGSCGDKRHSYFAYGRRRWGDTLPTDRTFTGQVQDASGLIYMNARYYDPQTGQFISPDTRVAQAVSLRALPKPGRASWQTA